MPLTAIDGQLVGTLTGLVNISGALSSIQGLEGTLATDVVIVRPIPEYDGEYIVDPSFDEQILETKDQRMTDDVTVNAIMVNTVSNPSGGNTVYIGGLINYA